VEGTLISDGSCRVGDETMYFLRLLELAIHYAAMEEQRDQGNNRRIVDAGYFPLAIIYVDCEMYNFYQGARRQ
jgi:hypothetical protein